MTDIRMEPLHEASVWTGDQLQDDHSWEYPLDDADRAELAAALMASKRRDWNRLRRRTSRYWILRDDCASFHMILVMGVALRWCVDFRSMDLAMKISSGCIGGFAATSVPA